MLASSSMSDISGPDSKAMSVKPPGSIAPSNSSSLPSIVKSIHGPGVKYLYLSGQKKFDSTYWDTKENQDYYNWKFHRQKLASQKNAVDAQLEAEMFKHRDSLVERFQKERMSDVKEIEEENKFLDEFTRNSMPDLLSYRLRTIVEVSRNNCRESLEKDRIKYNKILAAENNIYYGKMQKASHYCDFDKDGRAFKFHLQQMNKLTRFPALNSQLTKGPDRDPFASPRGKASTIPPLHSSAAGNNSDNPSPSPRRENQQLSPDRPPKRANKLAKESHALPPINKDAEKKKTLVSGMDDKTKTTVVEQGEAKTAEPSVSENPGAVNNEPSAPDNTNPGPSKVNIAETSTSENPIPKPNTVNNEPSAPENSKPEPSEADNDNAKPSGSENPKPVDATPTTAPDDSKPAPKEATDV